MLAVVSAGCASRDYRRLRQWRGGDDVGVHGRSAPHTMTAVHDGVEKRGSRAFRVGEDEPEGGEVEDAACEAEWVEWDE
jgi:hypothetical protein